jgi:pimeloyl-ACP methyl ester carboxylesterase
MNLLDRWLARLDCHLIYLRDRRKIGYTQGIPELGCDMAAAKRGLARLIDGLGVHRVALMGNSAGAAGALRYAHALEAERVLALSPITGGAEYAAKITPHLPAGAANPWGDLVPLYRDNVDVRVHIVYGEKNEGDTQQSQRMIGLPGVTVEAVPDWEAHHLIHGLLRVHRLDPLLRWLVSNEDEIAAESGGSELLHVTSAS